MAVKLRLSAASTYRDTKGMLDSRYVLRDYLASDIEADTSLQNMVHPEYPVTIEDQRRGFVFVHTPPMKSRQLVVEERATGRLVGAGGIVTPPDAIGQGSLWIGAGVEPSHRGRGIGRELARALEGAAIEFGAVRLWASAQVADARALRFLELLGFQERLRKWQSWLDVDRANLPELASQDPALSGGVLITTLRAEGETDRRVLEAVYRLVAATLGDGPRMGPYVPPTFDAFRTMMLEGEAALPEAFFLARVGDRYVGMSNLQRMRTEDRTLHLEFTATLPEYRGRGIATALKTAGIRYAREHGYRTIRTENDSKNDAIWAINEKLGFRRKHASVWAEKALSPRGS